MRRIFDDRLVASFLLFCFAARDCPRDCVGLYPMGESQVSVQKRSAPCVHRALLHLLHCGIKHIASLPRGSGQCNSCNALPHCLGAVGSRTPAMHCLTAWGQFAAQLLQCTASLPGHSFYRHEQDLADGTDQPVIGHRLVDPANLQPFPPSPETRSASCRDGPQLCPLNPLKLPFHPAKGPAKGQHSECV
jgi:hypothetical protein